MEIEASGAANGGPSVPSQSSTAIDPSTIIDHLVDLLSITLGASHEDLKSHGSLLSETKRAETLQRCQRFATESQVVLYVQKELVSADKANGVNGHSGRI